MNQVEADPAALHFYEEAAAAAADLGVSVDIFAASEEGMGLTFLEPLNSITGGATYLYHALDEANLPQARIYMNGQHVCLCCSSSCSKQIFCRMCSVVSSILFLKRRIMFNTKQLTQAIAVNGSHATMVKDASNRFTKSSRLSGGGK